MSDIQESRSIVSKDIIAPRRAMVRHRRCCWVLLLDLMYLDITEVCRECKSLALMDSAASEPYRLHFSVILYLYATWDKYNEKSGALWSLSSVGVMNGLQRM